jgi:hypothetical protein
MRNRARDGSIVSSSFPKQARHTGDQDVNSAANGSCSANQDLVQFGPNGTLPGWKGCWRS